MSRIFEEKKTESYDRQPKVRKSKFDLEDLLQEVPEYQMSTHDGSRPIVIQRDVEELQNVIKPLIREIKDLKRDNKEIKDQLFDYNQRFLVKKIPPKEVLANYSGRVKEKLKELHSITKFSSKEASLSIRLEDYYNAVKEDDKFRQRSIALKLVPMFDDGFAAYLDLFRILKDERAYLIGLAVNANKYPTRVDNSQEDLIESFNDNE